MKNTSIKNAVIIGGSNGIGLAVARLLKEKGVNLAIIGQNQARLKSTIELLKKNSHPSVKVYCVDASNLDSMKETVKQIENNFGKIDYLINSAGLSIAQTKGVLDLKNFNKLIQVNLNSVYISSMLIGYGVMKDCGSIVNITSVRGRTGTDSFSEGYAAAKAGVINLTKTFAIELAPKNIRVNAVAPGAIYPTSLSETWSIELRNKITSNVPLGRLGNPMEIAKTVIFLLSDDSSYITGQTIDVNGGLWMN